MTARNQPHKYRCETCEYQSKSDYIAGSGYCLKSKKGYLTSSNNRGFTLEEYTSALGCASHSDATKAEQRIADVKRFNPSTWNCPNSCLCPMCLDERDCEIPCEEYIKMARGCEDGCEHCKVKALLREKGE